MNNIEEKNYFQKNKTIIFLILLLFIMFGYYIYTNNSNVISNVPDAIIQSAGASNYTQLYISNFSELNNLLDSF
jgi:hypothetical protein